LGVAFALSEAAAGTILSAVGSAVASAGSELLGTFVASSATQVSIPCFAASETSTLDAIADNVTDASNEVWTNMLALLQDSAFRQHIFSNYGLLQALQSINAEGFGTGSTFPHNPLITGYTYATWQALVPAAFNWPDPPYVSADASVSLAALFSNKPSMLTEMLQTVYTLQGSDPKGSHPAAFYTMSAGRVDDMVGIAPLVAIINEWYLVDRTGKLIVPSLAQSLFGAGTQPLKLIPVDPDNNFAAWSGGWYFNETTPTGAVTTWYDVFVNWAEAAPAGYSPGIFSPQPATTRIKKTWPNVFYAPYVPVDDEPPPVNMTG